MHRRNMFSLAIASGAVVAIPTKTFATDCEPAESGSGSLVTVNKISKFAPRAQAQFVSIIVAKWSLAAAAEITTPLRVQHFFSQIATETGGLARIDENLNYSADRLLKIFPTRVTKEQAFALEHKPRETANHVYGNRLGNHLPDDGWNYRGSGFIQLTGRENFRKRGEDLNLELEKMPEIVRTPLSGFQAAIAYWKSKNVNPKADQNDMGAVRKSVNGGQNGIKEAKIWFARAKKIFVPEPVEAGEVLSVSAEEATAVAERLSDLGYIERSQDEAFSSSAISKALKAYQSANGLDATGVFDEDTLYSITDPDNKIHTE